MPVALALLAAVLWGSVDFAAGSTARRLSSPAVLLWATLLGLPFLALVVAVVGDLRFEGPVVAWGLAAGVAGAIGIGSLYEGLATGVMGVVAPISATAVVVPVVVGVATGDDLTAFQLVALVVAVVGIVLAGGPQLRAFRTGGHRPILWALSAAVFIGLGLVAIAEGSDTSAATTVALQRLTFLVVAVPVALPASGPRRPRPADLVPLALVGAGDLLANALFALATREGELAVVAVLASMYPIATVVLARRLHGERLQHLQLAGVVAALTGVSGVVAG